MSSLSDMDLEKGPQLSVWDISPPLLADSSALPEFTLSEAKIPLPSPPPSEKSHLLNYGDRLVSNYLGPRPHPRHENMNYEHTIIQATRFRHLNITRIQHDLLRLQHVLTCPGGGNEENLARLSPLLHEHTTAIRDWDFISQSTLEINNLGCIESLLSSYPEIPWDKATPPHRLALLREVVEPPQDLISFTRAALPRSWWWSKAERKLRPAAYKLHVQGVPGVDPRQLSLTVTILAGAIISLASSALILVPMIIMSFETDRTKSLVTVSVAVTLFGLCLAVVVHTKSSETFLATATYAAILVVFVGTNGSGPG